MIGKSVELARGLNEADPHCDTLADGDAHAVQRQPGDREWISISDRARWFIR